MSNTIHARLVNRSIWGFFLVAMIVVSLPATSAQASIIGQGGDVGGWWSGPPNKNSFRLNKYEDNKCTQVHLEQKAVELLPNTPYNAHDPGTYNNNGSLISSTIPVASARVNSYIFHFDPTSGIPTKTSTGYVDFSDPVYVISRNKDLDATDLHYGYLGVSYPGFLADRGFDLASRDQFVISNPSANVLRVQFKASSIGCGRGKRA